MMMNIRLFFSELKDHRQAMKVQHELLEIIAMTLIAIAADCDGWDEIEDFCQQYEEWLKSVVGLTLQGGVPSADTFERVWQRLDSKEFKASRVLPVRMVPMVRRVPMARMAKMVQMVTMALQVRAAQWKRLTSCLSA